MSSKVERYFSKLAADADVSESDFLVLQSLGIRTASDMAYRFPRADDLEEMLRECVLPSSAYDHGAPRGVQVFPRVVPEVWNAWKRGADAAAIRQLYDAAKAVCKKDLDNRETAETPLKMTPLIHSDMLEKARMRGNLPRLSSSEVPGCSVLSLVSHNHSVGGPLAFVDWAKFISLDEEQRQARLGIKRVEASKLTVSDSSLRLQHGSEVFESTRVENIVHISEVFKLRSVAYEILELVTFEVYEHYSSELVFSFRVQPPEKFRGPTLKELHHVDRVVHEHVLKDVGAGRITFEAGLREFTANRSHPFFLLLEPVPEGTPCRGSERLVQIDRSGIDTGMASSQQHQSNKGSPAGVSLCRVCGLPRDQHDKRRFCVEGAKPKSGGKAPGQKGGRGRQQGGGRHGKGRGGGGESRKRPRESEHADQAGKGN